MAKNTKQAKMSKAGGGRNLGTGKEPVTGLRIALKDAGISIMSDKIYGKDDLIFKSFAEYTPDLVSGGVEFELGSNYIVITSTQHRPGEAKPWTTRQVLEGAFRYKKGIITTAVIRSHATVNNGASGHETGDIQTFPGGKLRINNPSSSRDWSKVWHSDLAQELETATYTFTPGSSFDLFETGGGKSAFQHYGGGRFFSNGWETEPFAINLI